MVCVILFLGYKQISAHSNVSWGSEKDIGSSDSSDGYSLRAMNETDLALGELVLVNKGHPFSYSKGLDLVSIYDHKNECYFVRDKDVLLGQDVMAHLNDLLEGFHEATGLADVNVVSGFRTYDLQQELYDEALAKDGAVHTAMFVALAGCSEHHTGLAVDFSIFHTNGGTSASFDGSGEYSWFNDNAWLYGFVLRYPDIKSSVTNVGSEPWHYRYVGLPHAYYMEQNDLCLEEYIDRLRQYPYDGEHLNIDCAEQKYEVYFCKGTEVHVPEKRDYTLSGNNDDGFIVTVNIG